MNLRQLSLTGYTSVRVFQIYKLHSRFRIKKKVQ